ncbi:conserved protein of unknown function [Tenacibaculum sp. 190524A02b]
MKLLNKYSIDFKYINNRKTAIFLNKQSEILSQYLDIWRYPDEIEDTLLPAIESVLMEKEVSQDIDADMVGVAYIENNLTRIEDSDMDYDSIVLKTKDFQEIVLQWINFLKE